jgi:hypothetical protein
MDNETISIQPARMITPEKQARMNADAAKPLPGAPPAKAAPPSAKPLTPQEAAAAAKAMRARMQIFRDASDAVLNRDLLK